MMNYIVHISVNPNITEERRTKILEILLYRSHSFSFQLHSFSSQLHLYSFHF
ncbi:hypothetical protein ETTORE_0262 [Pseudomonas phage Ettore]|nr:hypothetical protein ETTORE_0262 [Pseudomonas phage Ettore]